MSATTPSGGLHPWTRGLLEQLIEGRLSGLSEFVKNCRSDVAKETFHLRTPDDFALGMLMGDILSTFETAFRGANNRDLNASEALEAMQVVYRRAEEIRNAVVGTSN